MDKKMTRRTQEILQIVLRDRTQEDKNNNRLGGNCMFINLRH